MIRNLPVSPVILAGVVIVLAAGIVTGFEVYQQNHKTVVAEATPTPTATVAATATPDSTASPTSLTEGDITWLASAQKVGDLKLFKADVNPEVPADYYKVGTKAGLDIVLAQVLPEGPAFYRDGFLFVQASYDHSHYSMVQNYNSTSTQYYTNATDANGKAESFFTTLVDGGLVNIPSLQLPGSFTAAGTQFEVKGDSFTLFSDLTEKATSSSVIAQTTWGPIYRVVQSKLDDGSTIENIILKRRDGTGQYYGLKDASFLKDDQIPTITWNDASKNTSTFRGDGGGSCGSATGLNVTDSLTGWVKSGTASDGSTVYEPTDTNNPIVKTWYDLSGGTYYDNNGGSHTLSYAEFVTKHPIIVYKDSLGRNLVLRNTTYGLNAECGKPVVYLYPTQKTQVQVSVGATFHHSIPASTGTWSVVAQPNGVITKDGQTFPYLYWSGQGKGVYPTITTGVVVPRDQVQTVLRQQLSQLGFTEQEAADFLDFWAQRMPTTPYTRLTWLGNKEMDALAPMSITPKPDVVIRRFLDFEGLQQPVSLTPQQLTAIPRHGFTAMEWGGLLRGN
jgi:hypothetical protein